MCHRNRARRKTILTPNKDLRKTAKRLIKQAKKHPDWYTEQDVSYAKLIKRINKKDKTNLENDTRQT